MPPAITSEAKLFLTGGAAAGGRKQELTGDSFSGLWLDHRHPISAVPDKNKNNINLLSDALINVLENILPLAGKGPSNHSTSTRTTSAISSPNSSTGDVSINTTQTDQSKLAPSSAAVVVVSPGRGLHRPTHRYDVVSSLLSSPVMNQHVLLPAKLIGSATSLRELNGISVGTTTNTAGNRDTTSAHARVTSQKSASPRSSRSPERGNARSTLPFGSKTRPIGDDHHGDVQRAPVLLPVVGPNDTAEASHARPKSQTKSRRRKSPKPGGEHQGDNWFSEFPACDDFGFLLSPATNSSRKGMARSKSQGTDESRAGSHTLKGSMVPEAWMRQTSEDRVAGKTRASPSKLKDSYLMSPTASSSPRTGRRQRLSLSHYRDSTGDPIVVAPFTLDEDGKWRWVSPGPNVFAQTMYEHSSERLSRHYSTTTPVTEPSRHKPMVSSESNRLRSTSHDGQARTWLSPLPPQEPSSKNHRNRKRCKNRKSSRRRSPVSIQQVQQEGNKARLPVSTSRKPCEIGASPPRSSAHSIGLNSSTHSTSLHSTVVQDSNQIIVVGRNNHNKSMPNFDLTSPPLLRSSTHSRGLISSTRSTPMHSTALHINRRNVMPPPLPRSSTHSRGLIYSTPLLTNRISVVGPKKHDKLMPNFDLMSPPLSRSSMHSIGLISSTHSTSLYSTALLANRIITVGQRIHDKSMPNFDLSSPPIPRSSTHSTPMLSPALHTNRTIAVGNNKHATSLANLELTSSTQSGRQRCLPAGGQGLRSPDISAGANFLESTQNSEISTRNAVRRQRHRKTSSMTSSESKTMVNQSIHSSTSFGFSDFDFATPQAGPIRQRQQVWLRRRLQIQGNDDPVLTMETAQLRHRPRVGRGSVPTRRMGQRRTSKSPTWTLNQHLWNHSIEY